MINSITEIDEVWFNNENLNYYLITIIIIICNFSYADFYNDESWKNDNTVLS